MRPDALSRTLVASNPAVVARHPLHPVSARCDQVDVTEKRYTAPTQHLLDRRIYTQVSGETSCHPGQIAADMAVKRCDEPVD